jgi:hypothetical protein
MVVDGFKGDGLKGLAAVLMAGFTAIIRLAKVHPA